MAAFLARGWYLGRALEIRLRVFRVGVGNLHDPVVGNIVSLDSASVAIGAVARHLAESAFWILTKSEPYRELSLVSPRQG